MSSRRAKGFEFKLGKLGLALFTFGISLVMLFAFIFGVIVGQNIESYPNKIAKSIPDIARKKIAEAEKQIDVGEVAKKNKEGDFKLTFYDTLTENKVKAEEREEKKPHIIGESEEREEKKPHIIGEAEEREEKKPHIIGESEEKKEKKPHVKGEYIIRVASFNDEKKADSLHKKLLNMGYDSMVDVIKLNSKGRWFRVQIKGLKTREGAKGEAAILENKIRGLRCLVVKK